MARAPDSRVKEAYELYKSGVKLVEIASQLTVPAGTVRRWKSIYKWDSERSDKNNERSDKKKNAKNKAVLKEVKQVLENPDLSDKQKLFCLYYSKSFNATQSYAKAYGCDWDTANASGPRMLVNVSVKEEIMRLKELKLQSLFVSESDFVDIHMRIAFADMGDYVSFGKRSIPILADGIPVLNDQGNAITYEANKVDLNESSNVDTQLIKEIKEGKDGISIKLLDRCKSLDWLDRYFLMNPMDKHRIEFDNKKLELEKLKIGSDNGKTVNIIHNIPRPPKDGDE